MEHLMIVVCPQGGVKGVFTCAVDAHLVVKATGGAVWRCAANSDSAVRMGETELRDDGGEVVVVHVDGGRE